jgi:hypothetical protein
VKTCPDCNGNGVIEKGTDDEQQCPTCGGSGFMPDDDNDDEEVTRTFAVSHWAQASTIRGQPSRSATAQNRLRPEGLACDRALRRQTCSVR